MIDMICNNCNRDIGYKAVCPYCGARMLRESLPHHLPVDSVIGGRYRIKGVLGEGGFGITYLGYNEKLDMPVAIKEYFPHGVTFRTNEGTYDVYAGTDDGKEFFAHGRERFLNEARVLARFSYEPGVVSVIDLIEENNTAYLIMEYLDGETLQQYLRCRGNMSAEEAFGMLEPVMRTLEKIHSRGVIHRDISPDNIMHLRNGSVKLMDFGCAKDFDGDNRSMSVMLKQGYAPEEQYRRNGTQGPWTDVYGLCATIYRCIVGKAPDDALDRLVDDGVKKPSELGVKISPKQEDALMYGLAVRKQDRCQSMTELLGCLENGTPKAAPPESDALRTVAADAPAFAEPDDANKTVYADQSFAPPAPDFHNADAIPDFNKGSASAQPKKSRKGLLIAIISLVFVAVITVAGVEIWKSSSPSNASDTKTAGSNGASFKYRVLDDGTAKIIGYTGSVSDIEIPSELDGHSVTSIGDSSFYYDFDNLTTVVIPDSVTEIGSSAFKECSSLKSVTIPDSVKNIGDYAFYKCRSLTSVTIPDSVTSIGEYAFYGCSSLTTVTIPNNVMKINENSFSYCEGITSVTIPDSVTEIGNYAFYECSNLNSVIIPDSVTSIGDFAFSRNGALIIYGKPGSEAERYANEYYWTSFQATN